MRPNRKLLAGGAIIIGAIVFLLLWNALRNRPATQPARTATNTVGTTGETVALTGRRAAVANQDIPERAIITPDMFTMQTVPEGAPADSYVSQPNAQAVGFIAARPIPKGTRFSPTSDFVGHISEVGIAGALFPGRRAMVIPVGNKPTLHDLVRVGNFVDVLAAFDGQESRSIVQNVRVLAVDVFGEQYPQTNVAMSGPYKADPKAKGIASTPPAPNAQGGAPAGATGEVAPTPTPAPDQPPPRPDPAITLEVTPQQANAILLAQASGATLEYILRPAQVGAVLVGTQVGPDGTPVEATDAEGNPLVVPVSVTKAQLAPYAERKKAGPPAPKASTRNVSSNNGNPGRIPREPRFTNLGPPPGGDFGPGPLPPVVVPQSPTYDIPIYIDGKMTRVDTVRRPGAQLGTQ